MGSKENKFLSIKVIEKINKDNQNTWSQTYIYVPDDYLISKILFCYKKTRVISKPQ